MRKTGQASGGKKTHTGSVQAVKDLCHGACPDEAVVCGQGMVDDLVHIFYSDEGGSTLHLLQIDHC